MTCRELSSQFPVHINSVWKVRNREILAFDVDLRKFEW